MEFARRISLYSPVVERAMRFAAAAHLSHVRKGTDIPYLTHLAGVALILTRAGFDDDDILSASLLHDVVEDTAVSLEQVSAAFGDRVAALVESLTEIKHDDSGTAISWRSRKEEQLHRLAESRIEARAIALADKVHNLGTLIDDLEHDPMVWGRFNASPAEQLWYYQAVLDAAGDEELLAPLVSEMQVLLGQLKTLVLSTKIDE